MIVGPSASGKSSILRAFRTLIQNQGNSKSYIKRDSDKAVVVFQVGEAVPVRWERHKREGVVYTIGDQRYEKVGRSKLEDFTKDFDIVIDDDGQILQLHDEWSTLFPFGLTATQVFKIFEKMLRISDSVSVFKCIKSDQSDLHSKIAVLGDRRERLEIRVNEIDELVTEVSLTKVELAVSLCKKWRGIVEEFEDSVRQVIGLQEDIGNLSSVLEKRYDKSLVNPLNTFIESDFGNDIEEAILIKPLLGMDVSVGNVPLYDVSRFQECLDDFQEGESLSDEIYSDKEKIDLLKAEIFKDKKEFDKQKRCPLCGSSL